MTTTGIIKEKVIGCKNIDRDNDRIRIAVTRRKVNRWCDDNDFFITYLPILIIIFL
jgi:hypothetical protein